MFAKRTEWSLRLNRLTQTLHKIRSSGREILDLTESNPTRCGFQYPAELLAALHDPENLNYAPSPKGMLQARETIAAYYAEKGVSVNPEQIILTASTSEAYSFLFRLLLNPGDHLLIPQPSYPLFEYLASLNDVILDPYNRRDVSTSGPNVSPGDRSEPSLETSLCRSIVLVHPNNPTGLYVTHDEKKFLEQVAKEKNLSLICDEVFLDYAYEEDASRVPTFAGCDEVLTFTLSGISKILALPQMKLSWIVVSGPEKLRDQAIERLELISDTYLSVNTPSQQALQTWFSFRESLQKEIQNRIFANRKVFEAKCQGQNHYKLLHAEGGWYATIRLPDACDEEKWVLELLEKESVLVHPGYFYDFNEAPFVVVSLLLPTTRFKRGVESLFNLLKLNKL